MTIFDVPLDEYDRKIAQAEEDLAGVQARLPVAQAHAAAEARRLATPLEQATQALERARSEWHRRQARTAPGPQYAPSGGEMGYFARSLPAVLDAEAGNAMQRQQLERLADQAAEGRVLTAEAAHRKVVEAQRAADGAVTALRQQERRLSAEVERLRYERARVVAGPVAAPAEWGDPATIGGGLLAGVRFSGVTERVRLDPPHIQHGCPGDGGETR